MKPINNGDKEKQTPADSATDDKILSEEQIEARLKEKKTQLSQLEEATNKATESLKSLRSQIRDVDIFGEKNIKSKEKKLDDIDDEDDVQDKISIALMEEKTKDRLSMYNIVVKEFINERDEFSPENDIGQELFSEFINRAKNMFLGQTERQVNDSLQFILDGLLAKDKSKKEDKKIDFLGDIDTNNIKPKTDDVLEEWKVKKLNKYEQAAADNYPGGEKAYRIKMAELARKKSS